MTELRSGAIFSVPNTYRTPLIIAHRGCNNYAPQNSLPAFEAVAKLGVWAIETDIRLTRDGVAVCIHDAVIDTMTDSTGEVSELTFEQLSRARINRGVGADTFPEDLLRIPTFDEYLDLCKKYGCVPFIELKTPEGAEIAIDKLRARDLEDYAVISSVKFEYLEESYRLSKKVFIHHIFSKEKYFDRLGEMGYAGLSLKLADPDLLEAGTADALHERGLRFCLRAADTPEKMRQMIDLGLDYQPSNCVFGL